MPSYARCCFKKKRGRSKKQTNSGLELKEIHSVAFGEIGLTPYQFYCLTPYEFDCIVLGWRKKRAYEQSIVRTQTAFIVKSWVGKFEIRDYWPIDLIDNDTRIDKPRGLTRRGAIAIMKKVQARHDSQYKSNLN